MDAAKPVQGAVAEAGPKIYGVSELTGVIKDLLKPFDKIYVEGELSGWKVYSSGHAYFTLKDEGAQLSCVMFASSIARCKAAGRLRDGAKVCLYGRLDVYAQRGNYQMVVLAAKIAGEGELMARFNELKEKLQKEGLFDASRKRRLPFLPHRIGIVTSPSGAVIHDICRVLTRRFPNIEVRLYPVKVQGEGAKDEVVAGIEFFNRQTHGWRPDVLIVGRGGGSIEDLWPFNEEVVVRAVASSAIPVISAVGHQTDFTLCDFAADIRAGTPSIAAEIVVPEKDKLAKEVAELAERLVRAPQRACETHAQTIDHLLFKCSSLLCAESGNAVSRLTILSQRLAPALKEVAAREERRIAGAEHRLEPALNGVIMQMERRVALAEQRLLPAFRETAARDRQRLSTAGAKLALLDPADPLKRGYSLTFDGEGRILRKASDVRTGDVLTTRLGDGSVTSVAK